MRATTRFVFAVALALSAVACGRHTATRGLENQQRHDEHVFAGGVAPSGVTPRNPYRGDRASIEAGQQLFATMNCDGCHGDGGGWVGPSLSDGRWRFGGSDGDLYQSISAGRPHGMPAYGGLMPPDAIWKVVTYIQSLTPPADVPTESWK